MKLIQILLISFFTLISCFSASSVQATDDGFLGKGKISSELYDSQTDENITQSINTALKYIIGFVYFLAILYGIWGGFTIMTAAGDDEKVKKGRTVIIQAIIGIIIIFLAGAIVNFILDALSKR